MIDTDIENRLYEKLKKELMKPKKVYIEKCREDVDLPFYAHTGDAGMDVRAAVDVVLNPGETKVVPTGIKVIIPDGYEIQIRPRSGLSLKTPIRVTNTPGTIDSGYRDEIGIILTNSSVVSANDNLETYDMNEKENRPGIYKIKKGDRIAQMVLCKYERIEFETDKTNIKTDVQDRGGAFGHSGVN